MYYKPGEPYLVLAKGYKKAVKKQAASKEIPEAKEQEPEAKEETPTKEVPKPPSNKGIIPPDLTLKFYEPLSIWYADQIEARGLEKGEIRNQFFSLFQFRHL